LILELKYLVLFGALALASYQDVRTREIEDKIWLIAGAICAVLTAYEALTLPSYPIIFALASIGLTALLAIGIYFLGLYGGADAKALIVIAVTLPLSSSAAGSFYSPFFPLTVLGNALLCSLVLVPACLIYNVAWRISRRKALFGGIRAGILTKIGALLTGIKVKPKTAELVHFNTIEVYADGDPTRLKLFSKVTDEGKVKLIDEKADYVWVTPAIPMLVFFLVGFIMAVLGADLIFGLLALIL